MKLEPSNYLPGWGRCGIANLMKSVENTVYAWMYHAQFNVVDRDTLIDAQAHPKNTKIRWVRVAGYTVLCHWQRSLDEIYRQNRDWMLGGRWIIKREPTVSSLYAHAEWGLAIKNRTLSHP